MKACISLRSTYFSFKLITALSRSLFRTGPLFQKKKTQVGNCGPYSLFQQLGGGPVEFCARSRDALRTSVKRCHFLVAGKWSCTAAWLTPGTWDDIGPKKSFCHSAGSKLATSTQNDASWWPRPAGPLRLTCRCEVYFLLAVVRAWAKMACFISDSSFSHVLLHFLLVAFNIVQWFDPNKF